jgi:hypothetical protein
MEEEHLQLFHFHLCLTPRDEELRRRRREAPPVFCCKGDLIMKAFEQRCSQ